jgi:tetratricopeptide (TPR) repeat protein
MADSVPLAEFKEGMRMFRRGNTRTALAHFRKAAEMEPQNPYYMSFTGVAMARSEKQFAFALELCETALRLKRNEVQLHLNLALLKLERAAASFGGHAGLQRARLNLGSRRPPVLSVVSRDNVLNKKLGLLRQRILDWVEGSRFRLLHSS